MATIGNTAKPTSGMVMTSLNNQNQVALKVTMPQAGTITRVGVWCAGNNSDATMKVCVWNSSGSLLRESASFDANGQTLAQGNSSNYERDLTSPLNVNDGQVLYIGFSADPTEARQWGVNGSGTHYRDTSTGQGQDANFGSFSGSIGAYAEYSTAPTNVRPDAPTINFPKGGNIQNSSPDWPALNFTHHDDDGDPISGYDIDVDNNSGFGSPIWDAFNASSGISGDTVNRTPSGVSPSRGIQYYWRARTRDAVGAGPWSGTYSFIINSLPVATKVAPLAGGLAFIHNLAELAVWTVGGAHAKPRFQWSYSDAESQPQKQFQVKVYDAAGTTLLHDSGPITSTATTYDAPWALVHDTVYQWSVEVFDSIEWSVLAKSTFKVKWAQGIYETPALPASSGWTFASTKAGAGQTAILFATATNTNGAGRSAWVADIGALTPAARLNVLVRLAHQTGTAPTVTNMTFAYSVGVGVMPDNWLFTPAASWSLNHDIVRFGSQAVKCVVGSTADQTAKPYRVASTDHIPVKGATTYVFSCYVKTDEARPHLTGSNKIVLEVYPAGSSDPIPAHPEQPFTDYETQDTTGQGDRNWQRLHYVFTTDQDHTEVDVLVTYRNIGATANGDVFYLDGAQLESGQVVTAWSPGQIASAGAVVTDAAGVQIDAVQGGILRLRAAEGGDRDLVELGDRGLLLGGDTDVYSPESDLLARWDGLQDYPLTPKGYLPFAPLTDASVGWPNTLALSVGNSAVQPIFLSGPMLAVAVGYVAQDTSLARSGEVRLYYPRPSGSILDYVPGSQVLISYTQAAIATRFATFTTPIMLPPGVVFVVVRNTHASQTLGLGRSAAGAATNLAHARCIAQQNFGVLGATLDLTAGPAGNQSYHMGFILIGSSGGRNWT